MLNDILKKRLFDRDQKMLTRQRITIKNKFYNKIYIFGKECINFSSNDYLGLMGNTTIKKSFSKAARKYGLGSGASALISGYSEAHARLEQQFADWLQVEQCILFNSGYLANLGVITTLANRSNNIFSDKLCHASLLDGIQLSKARHYRYKHNDCEHLQKIAKNFTPHLIVTESVFSMEGDIAPIQNILKIAHDYNASLIVDDAHGIGVLGKNGKGIHEHLEINLNKLTCLIVPLGKSFNAMGCIVAGRHEVIDAMIQFSKTYCYTTAIPAAICESISTALNVVINETWRRETLKTNIQFFLNYAKTVGLEITSQDETPIKSILVYNNETAIQLQNFLLLKGFYVSSIRPPTAPLNTARLRISLNCLHTKEEIAQLIHYISGWLNNVKK